MAVAAALLAAIAAFFSARVIGISMSPTLMDGDALFVDKVNVSSKTPQRGDIVVAAEPTGATFVKRVIAVPGDVVEIDGSGAHPVVLLRPGGNGSWQRLEEPYTDGTWSGSEFCCDSRGYGLGGSPQPLKLLPDRFFLLGDNRNASTDSRRYGLFSRSQIVGRVVVRWWPLTRAGALQGGPELVRA